MAVDTADGDALDIARQKLAAKNKLHSSHVVVESERYVGHRTLVDGATRRRSRRCRHEVHLILGIGRHMYGETLRTHVLVLDGCVGQRHVLCAVRIVGVEGQTLARLRPVVRLAHLIDRPHLRCLEVVEEVRLVVTQVAVVLVVLEGTHAETRHYAVGGQLLAAGSPLLIPPEGGRSRLLDGGQQPELLSGSCELDGLAVVTGCRSRHILVVGHACREAYLSLGSVRLRLELVFL